MGTDQSMPRLGRRASSRFAGRRESRCSMRGEARTAHLSSRRPRARSALPWTSCVQRAGGRSARPTCECQLRRQLLSASVTQYDSLPSFSARGHTGHLPSAGATCACHQASPGRITVALDVAVPERPSWAGSGSPAAFEGPRVQLSCIRSHRTGPWIRHREHCATPSRGHALLAALEGGGVVELAAHVQRERQALPIHCELQRPRMCMRSDATSTTREPCCTVPLTPHDSH